MVLFITAFIAMLVIVDPLGNAAVFAGLTAGKTKADAFKIALKATLVAIGVLLFFGYAGAYILDYMGISNDAFKIAGGLLLFYTAFNMVMGGHEQTAPQSAKTSEDLAVFPMAIPLMAGPGCATAFILLLEKAERADMHDIYIIAAMILVEVLTFIALATARPITQILGRGALSILARIMGILLAALSVQFIVDGVLAVAA